MHTPICIYTDGSCLGNQFDNACGGYGAIMQINGDTIELAQGYSCTTNNRMELRAVIAALKVISTPSLITIMSDSKYVVEAFKQGWIDKWNTNGWKKSNRKPVENQDLWKEMLETLHSHNVEWLWVKGHSGNSFNERADHLACIAAASDNMLEDVGLTTATIVHKY
ncbi:ribonuclease HI [Desulfovibrio sp. UCD-KL4C]|uniref:ribonuclease HI n=1 Tax=Desulfovibrio sp. UCD-KL4C TaxID=2578120 RepID=UPI0025BD4EC8|nr:ribonuclease HI [Desulfovibrio sp. UCD-KL4C]